MEKSIFSEILDKALKNSASDIHIGAGEHPLMRVDGLLRVRLAVMGETDLLGAHREVDPVAGDVQLVSRHGVALLGGDVLDRPE